MRNTSTRHDLSRSMVYGRIAKGVSKGPQIGHLLTTIYDDAQRYLFSAYPMLNRCVSCQSLLACRFASFRCQALAREVTPLDLGTLGVFDICSKMNCCRAPSSRRSWFSGPSAGVSCFRGRDPYCPLSSRLFHTQDESMHSST